MLRINLGLPVRPGCELPEPYVEPEPEQPTYPEPEPELGDPARPEG